MKMPEKIEPAMFAPCGMNCMVCYKHCYHKKPCEGCLKSDKGKPEHYRKCKIKDCIKEKNLSYCYECNSYPCKQIKRWKKVITLVTIKASWRIAKQYGTMDYLPLWNNSVKYIPAQAAGA